MTCPFKKTYSKPINPYKKLDELYDKLQSGFYDDKPPYSFAKDELYLKYYLGLISEHEYYIGKRNIARWVDEYNYNKYYKKSLMIIL